MKSLKLLIAIVWLVFLILVVVLVLEIRQGDSLRKEAADISKRIDDAEKARPKLKILAKDIEDLEQELSKINLKIPDNEQVPLELIKQLTVMANKEKLKKIRVSYGDNSSSAQMTTTGGLKVNTVVITLACEAGYPNLMAFLKQVADMDRIIYVDEVRIERVKDMNPRQRVSVKLLAYTFITS